MKVNGKPYHTIWVDPENISVVKVIDQGKLPFEFEIAELKTCEDAFTTIHQMVVRGAPLIGVTGAYGIYLALLNSKDPDWKEQLRDCAEHLKSARPTAVNLSLLIDEMVRNLSKCSSLIEAVEFSLAEANRMKNREIEWSEAIGNNGCNLIERISERKKGEAVNILTHCNAGWLACIDWGTATAPIYKAFQKGIPIHVWVDETRPRNQGARLTAWELSQEGIPHTVIPDNTGGHLMQHGLVDLCIVGSDRTTSTGDVANKIGTYLKALAAADNKIPFYVALPSTSIDFSMRDGLSEIPIESRGAEEVRWMEGINSKGEKENVRIIPDESPVANWGFDVTPAKYITGLITERGICKANSESILALFPEKEVKEDSKIL
jgi:methylthioribose-1-phosphate isomerase